jgi:hypothetical protein
MAEERTERRGGARRNAGRPRGKVSQAKRDLMEMAKDHGETALQVLVDIATNPASAEGARVSAANAILDRGYGRPTQTVDNKSTDGSMSPKRIEIVAVNGNVED